MAADGPIFLPYLLGNRDNPNACAGWSGLRQYHNRGDLLRAVYEGVALSHRHQLEYLLVNRESPKEICFAGGVAHSHVWRQIFADVLGIPLRIVASEEMGAKGAAITAAVAAGFYDDIRDAVKGMVRPGSLIVPDGDSAAVYDRKYEVFRRRITNADD